jgi:hypothetical protein
MTDQHLDSDVLAAWAERRLPADLRSTVASHLAECPACRSELTAAALLIQGDRRRRRRLIAVPALAAAVLLLVVASDPFGTRRHQAEDRILRAGDQSKQEGTLQLGAIAPVEGATVSRESLRFIWQGDGADALFRFTLAGPTGEQLWQTTTRDTTIALPDTVTLEPGERYLWWVDVLLTDARTATTGPREFTVAR